MAATDQPYRSQKTLDLVFGVSCVALLASTVWMFWQDYAREYKSVQRTFRDVEASIAEREMIDKMPDAATVAAKRNELQVRRDELKAREKDLAPEKARLDAQRERADEKARGIKADYDAQMSYWNIAADEVGKVPPAESRHATLVRARDAERTKLDKLESALAEALAALAKIDLQIKENVREALDPYEKAVADADESLKRTTALFDRYAKQAARTSWGPGDEFRRLPIIDGFESPTKIKQLWLPDLTIDYGGFRDVPRYDRCTSCHLGIDRGNYDRATLRALNDKAESARLTGKVEDAQKMLEKRVESGENIGFDPGDLPSERPGSWGKLAMLILACAFVAAASLGVLERSFRLALYTLTVGMLLSLGTTALIAGVYSGAKAGLFGDGLKRATRRMQPQVVVKAMDPPLSDGQVSQYCAHPRLDLFVDSNSPHPMEKFGCTTCHSGQGSATDFINAVHTPNNSAEEKRWTKAYGWEAPHSGEFPPNYHWDFPMLQKRFVESSCLKCHHQVTDLIRHGSKEEAPKLLRGYNLIKEMGCFGCHEIQGVKSGRWVGPDLRLEPGPALDWLSAADKDRLTSDPNSPVGNLRKVGPSLRRLSEKVGEEWTRKWIDNPRGFRDDTRMPHFYNLSTNSADTLPDDQKTFPATEVHAISHYLMLESRRHLKAGDTYRDVLLGEPYETVAKKLRWAEIKKKLTGNGLGAGEKDALNTELEALAKEGMNGPAKPGIRYAHGRLAMGPLTDRQVKDLYDISKRFSDLALLSSPTNAVAINSNAQRQRQLQERLPELHRRAGDAAAKTEMTAALAELYAVTAALERLAVPTPISVRLASDEGAAVDLPKEDGDKNNGRRLFTEKGCLACHAHQGTTGKDDANKTIGVVSEANFGPELSRIADKLLMADGKAKNDPTAARRWLVQWVMNPNVYHPRTRMPVTHLSAKEANDIASWLLSQRTEWKGVDPAADVDEASLRALVRLNLMKAPGVTRAEVNLAVPETGEIKGLAADRVAMMPRDMDERELVEPARGPVSKETLLWYVGKRAVGRQGCYGCHDIPGFETAKPIGTGLNDWGKKDHDKLAFEDGEAWAHKHYTVVPSRTTRRDVEQRVLALWKKAGERLSETKPAGDDNALSDKEKFTAWLEKVGNVTKAVEGATGGELLMAAEDRLDKDDAAELSRLKHRLRADQEAITKLEEKKLKEGLTKKEKKEYEDLHPLQFFEPAGKKSPIEETFFEALEHHHREGFLALKLMEPRSYDYNRIKPWDDRLRMPQFKFARSRKKAGESEEQYKARLEVDEAEAREAVMTFILGLVAEPVPLKYVNVPKAEKAAETAGRQVLDKYNCAGCHQVRPGVYEFKPEQLAAILTESHNLGGNRSRVADDFHFPNTTAWVGQAPAGERHLAFGYLDAVKSRANDEADDQLAWQRGTDTIRLTDALRFVGPDGVERNMPAGLDVFLPRGKYTASAPYGGTYAELLSPYLLAKDKTKYPTPQGHLPPPLVREGERVQPDWLYRFLLNPGEVRPDGYLVLRMPKFNMSPEEARALVNYFAASSRMTNPAQGVTYPYVQVDQREPSFWRQTATEYRLRLEATEKEPARLKEQIAALEKAAADPKSKTKDADAKKAADLKQSLSVAETRAKIAADLLKDEAPKGTKLAGDSYSRHAYKLLTNRDLCLKCHNIGSITIEGAQGPNLSLAAERLRPEWMEQWIAKPPRLFPYEPVMPQNFPNKANPLEWVEQKSFLGTPLQQTRAVRDILMDSARLSELIATIPPPPPPPPAKNGDKK